MSIQLLSIKSPQVGKWYIKTIGNQQTGALLHNPGTGHKANWLVPRVFPYSFAKIKFRWTELVNDEETAKNATIIVDGKVRKKYISYQKFFNSGLIIGTREEYVEYLRETEVHPHVLEVTSNDGSSLEIILQIAIKITSPLLAIALEDFLGVANGLIGEAIFNWANTQSNAAIRQIDTDKVKKSISIDGIYFINYLNNLFRITNRGIQIEHVAVINVPVAERSKDVLEREEAVQKAIKDTLISAQKRDQLLLLNEATAAQKQTELTFQEGMYKAKGELINAIKEALEAQNKAYGLGGLKSLYLGGGNNILEKIIEGNFVSNGLSNNP